METVHGTDISEGIGETPVERLHAAVTAIPGVRDAAVAIRRRPRLELGLAVRASTSPRAGLKGGRTAQAEGGNDRMSPRPRIDRTVRPALVHGARLEPASAYPATLQAALRGAAGASSAVGSTYILPAGSEDHQSYAELLEDAQRVLAGLRRNGVRPGDAVLFQYERNRSLVTTFWACVLGGFVATPVAVPPTYRQETAPTRKLRNAWELLGRPVIIADRSLLSELQYLATRWGETVRVEEMDEFLELGPDEEWFDAAPADPVVHLLTSGSTGIPKCVRHTHENILARTLATTLTNGFDSSDVTVNWMPLDHVSIVMYNARDVVLRCRHVNAKVETFLADPLIWLDWIDRYRGTNTWAPNFAFALVNERAATVRNRSWDLSCMRNICNAAEPIVAQTAREFLRLLEPHGLPADAMWPCWGMSETCSGVTYSRLSRHDNAIGTVSAAASSLGGELKLCDLTSPDAIELVGVGEPIPGVDLRIVDVDDQVVSEGVVGRLQVRGSAMMSGYYGNPDANREAWTEDRWFRTGDLAFLLDGELTITGREKDVIIVNGLNYLNHELESVVEQAEGVEVSHAAACALSDEAGGSDELVLFFSPSSRRLADQRTTIDDIRTRLASETGLQAKAIVPVPRDQFPKTTSGKIQRAQLLKDFVRGAFDEALVALDREPAGHELPRWFFEKVWCGAPSSSTRTPPDGIYLLFEDERMPIADALRELLGDRRLLVVRFGGAYAQIDQQTFTILPNDESSYARVLECVAREGVPLAAVIHAGALASAPTDALDPKSVAETLSRGTLSALLLFQQLVRRDLSQTCLLVATSGAHWVREGDAVEPAKATVTGLVRTANAEGGLAGVRHVDADGDAAAIARAILNELCADDEGDVVAWRGYSRLVPRLRPSSIPADAAFSPAVVPGSCYLVTGGLGGIGSELARYLLGAYDVKLLLVGRSDLSTNSERARLLDELAAVGDVHYERVDVTDVDGISEAVGRAEERWGQPLSGVLHIAGADLRDHWESLEAHALRNETPEMFERMFAAKVFGACSLAELLRARPDAELMLFSSVNGYFGGSSFGAYSAANCFLDALAEHWAREVGRPAKSLAWSMWTRVGMNVDSPARAAAVAHGFQPIDPDKGLMSFLVTTRIAAPQILIGLNPRREAVRRELAPESLGDAEVVVAYVREGARSASTEDICQAVLEAWGTDDVSVVAGEVLDVPRDAAGRVDLSVVFAEAEGHGTSHEEPIGDLERELASIWSELLRRPHISRSDSFFQLGGNSLRAQQLRAALVSRFACQISLRELYEHSTLADLRSLLEERGHAEQAAAASR